MKVAFVWRHDSPPDPKEPALFEETVGIGKMSCLPRVGEVVELCRVARDSDTGDPKEMGARFEVVDVLHLVTDRLSYRREGVEHFLEFSGAKRTEAKVYVTPLSRAVLGRRRDS